MTDKPDAGEAARRMLAIASPKEQSVSYVYDGDRRRADMQLVARAYLAQAAEIERLRAAVATSRREALEEAAKVADQRADYWDAKDDGVEMAPMVAGAACAGVAIAIRALFPLPAKENPDV